MLTTMMIMIIIMIVVVLVASVNIIILVVITLPGLHRPQNEIETRQTVPVHPYLSSMLSLLHRKQRARSQG